MSVQPNPIKPSDFLLTLPVSGKTVCQKVNGLVDFYALWRQLQGWMFTDTGAINRDGFGDAVCKIDCNNLPAPGAGCTAVGIIPLAVPGNGRVDFTFNCTGGAQTGMTWNLYRATTDQDVVTGTWGAAIATGTSDGTTIVTADTTAVNDTAYYYKFSATVTGCPTYAVKLGPVTPALCRTTGISLTITATTPAAGSANLRLNGIPAAGWTVNWYRSTSAGVLGSAASLSDNGDYSYSDAGLDSGTKYYYTATVSESVACLAAGSSWQSTTSITPNGGVTAPNVIISGENWTGQAGGVVNAFQIDKPVPWYSTLPIQWAIWLNSNTSAPRKELYTGVSVGTVDPGTGWKCVATSAALSNTLFRLNSMPPVGDGKASFKPFIRDADWPKGTDGAVHLACMISVSFADASIPSGTSNVVQLIG